MNSVNPKSLQKGDMIGLVSPSGQSTPEALESGIRYLEKKGFRCMLGHPSCCTVQSSTDKYVERANEIIDFFNNPEIKAIIATCGGQESQRLLPLLDYNVIRNNPKILAGFSDTTALQLGLLKKTGLVTYTGFTLTIQVNSMIDRTLMSCLTGKSYKIKKGTPVHPGIAVGPLVGGNLTLISTLMGTPYQPDFNGKILIFEDVGAAPYDIDRMLSQLDLAGVFDQVFGIIIGQFEHCISKHPSEEGTVNDVINEWSAKFNVPCLKDFPYGHGDKHCVLPIGKNVTLDVGARTVSIA